MDITITIPDDVAEIIGALENGKPVDTVIRELVEEKYASRARPGLEGRLTFADLAGMFSSSEPVDTARRASEILRAEMGISGRGRDER